MPGLGLLHLVGPRIVLEADKVGKPFTLHRPMWWSPAMGAVVTGLGSSVLATWLTAERWSADWLFVIGGGILLDLAGFAFFIYAWRLEVSWQRINERVEKQSRDFLLDIGAENLHVVLLEHKSKGLPVNMDDLTRWQHQQISTIPSKVYEELLDQARTAEAESARGLLRFSFWAGVLLIPAGLITASLRPITLGLSGPAKAVESDEEENASVIPQEKKKACGETRSLPAATCRPLNAIPVDVLLLALRTFGRAERERLAVQNNVRTVTEHGRTVSTQEPCAVADSARSE